MTNTKKAISIIAFVLLVVLGACSLGIGARKNTEIENKSENKEPKTETVDEKDKDNSETKIAEDKAKDDKKEDETGKNTDEKEESATVSENKTDDKTEKVNEKAESKVEVKEEVKPAETKEETKPAVTTTPVAKPAETKPATTKPATTTPTAPKPAVKQPVVTTKDETVALPFTTERAYNIPGAQTRVKRQGVNGSVTYRITYKDGVQVKKEEVKRVAPVNQIIETYVKVQDRKVETRRVEDKSRPIYNQTNMYRVELYYTLDPSLNFVIENLDVDAARREAIEEWKGNRPRGAANNDNLTKRFGNIGVTGWRDLQPRAVDTNEIIGYEFITKEVVVQEELWAWK